MIKLINKRDGLKYCLRRALRAARRRAAGEHADDAVGDISVCRFLVREDYESAR